MPYVLKAQCGSAMKTAKVFRHSDSQAGRLSKRITLEQLDSIFGAFRGRFVRRQPRMQKRRWS